MLKLKIVDVSKPKEERNIELIPEEMYNGECFLGRSSNCTIVLSNIEVSRLHGSISYQQNKYFYTDLASRYGSLLNNEKIKINQKYPLEKNDIIRICDFVITVEDIIFPSGDKTTITTVSPQLEKTESKAPQPALSPEKYMVLATIPPEEIKRWQKGDLKVQCLQIIEETEDVKTFRFVSNPPVLFTYQPGQFITLSLNIDGQKVKRSYSISSTPSRPHCLEITVKRAGSPPEQPDVPAGLVSNWLHDRLQVGDEIEINGPSGKFTCFANPSPELLFISAGSGITPMMSMARWAFDTLSNLDIVFVHSARTPRDIIFADELQLLCARHSHFRLAYTITRTKPGQPWAGYIGRIDRAMLESMAPDFKERTVYVCGPDPFMASIKATLAGAGFPLENYYQESFGGLKKPIQKVEPPAPEEPAEMVPPEPIDLSSSLLKRRTKPPVSRPGVEPTVLDVGDGSTPSNSAPAAPAVSPPAQKAVVIFKGAGQEVIGNGGETILDLAETQAIEIDYSCRSGSCGTCKIKKLEGEIEYDGEPEALDEIDRERGYILSCIAIPKGKVVVDETDTGRS